MIDIFFSFFLFCVVGYIIHVRNCEAQNLPLASIRFIVYRSYAS